jgi:hypothetical protein
MVREIDIHLPLAVSTNLEYISNWFEIILER